MVLFMYPSKPRAKVTIALGFSRDPISFNYFESVLKNRQICA
jgi:hypothetical protein